MKWKRIKQINEHHCQKKTLRDILFIKYNNNEIEIDFKEISPNDVDFNMFETIISMYIVNEDEMKTQQHLWMIPEKETTLIMEREKDVQDE